MVSYSNTALLRQKRFCSAMQPIAGLAKEEREKRCVLKSSFKLVSERFQAEYGILTGETASVTAAR